MNDYIFDPQDNKKKHYTTPTVYERSEYISLYKIYIPYSIDMLYDTKIEFVILIKFN